MKGSQDKRLGSRLSKYVPDWKANVKLKKLTAKDLILAEQMGFFIVNGEKEFSENAKKLILVSLGIEGLEGQKEFLEGEAAGLIDSILAEIWSHSGFNTLLPDEVIEKAVEAKKKD